MDKRDAGPFVVQCRECGRTVLVAVERIGDTEGSALRAHLTTCCADRAAALSTELGTLLARFDVRNAH